MINGEIYSIKKTCKKEEKRNPRL